VTIGRDEAAPGPTDAPPASPTTTSSPRKRPGPARSDHP
jgi:hypothetical protein